MKRRMISAMLLAMALAQPVYSQRKDDPPPAPPRAEQVGPSNLLLSACPSDFKDGPYYENGHPYYGIPARTFVESFLASPETADPWAAVGVSSLRLLADGTDDTMCRRLTTILTGGTRNSPPPEPWVYFTAGGFIFVSSWKHAQPLSNYTTSYGHVMVFDSAFNRLGAYEA